MKSKSLFNEFFQYVALNVFGMIGLSCYILADTFFVSNGLGANGLTALNLAIPVYSFIHGTGLMLGMGGATKYSIMQGQNNHQKANQVFSGTVLLAILSALVFVFMGLFLSEQLTGLLGADNEVFAMTKTYIRFILIFAPAFIINDVLICFVRNDGSPRLSMAAMLIGSISNIFFDYLFIFPLQMGIFGAVLATGFAPVIGMTILSRHWTSGNHHFHLQKTGLSSALTKTILALGLPSLISEAASGIVIIVFNLLILRLQGNIGVAAYGVIANLSLVVSSVDTGIGQGIQPIISRFYGIGDKENIRKTLIYGIVTVLLISCGIYLLFFAAADLIAGIFNREQNILLQQIAVNGIKLYFTAVPFAGLNIIFSLYFTSTEQPVPAQIISLSRGFLLLIPAAFLLSFFIKMTGVWLSYPITEGIVTLIGIGFIKQSKRRMISSY